LALGLVLIRTGLLSSYLTRFAGIHLGRKTYSRDFAVVMAQTVPVATLFSILSTYSIK